MKNKILCFQHKMSLLFKELIGFSEAGYVDVPIDISGPEQIDVILSEGFIFRKGATRKGATRKGATRKGATEAGSHVVSWKNATRGLAKECREKAVAFWKTHIYQKIFYAAKNGRCVCDLPEPLFPIFSLEFEQDGFEVQTEQDLIRSVSWDKAKFGKAVEMRNITEKSNC